MEQKLAWEQINPAKALTLKQYMSETNIEIKSRIQALLRYTDDAEIESILSETINAWNQIDEVFNEHNRTFEQTDPEIKKKIEQVCNEQLRRFRADEVMDT